MLKKRYPFLKSKLIFQPKPLLKPKESIGGFSYLYEIEKAAYFFVPKCRGPPSFNLKKLKGGKNDKIIKKK